MIKRINKFISIVLILFFIAMPFANAVVEDPDISSWENNQNVDLGNNPESSGSITETQGSDNKITDGFGVYIKLVMYDEDTKREEIIGTPILLYSGPLLDNIKEDRVFKKEESVVWVCRNCGHVHVGKVAPKVCPTCNHPQSYFEVKSINY